MNWITTECYWSKMEFLSEKVKKIVEITDGKIVKSYLLNRISGNTLPLYGYEFGVSYRKKKRSKKAFFCSNDANLICVTDDEMRFEITHGGIDWKINLKFSAEEKSGVLHKTVYLTASDKSVIIDFLDLDCFDVAEFKFRWDIPQAEKRVYIPSYITTMGQPYYVEDMFFGGEFPTADNRIVNNMARTRYHIGRSLAEISQSGSYKSVPFVMGSGISADFYSMRSDFFRYIEAIRAQKSKLRIQYNSWYDNMLDIDDNNIEASFTAVAESFKKAGLRPLDCFVVDDGWIDYTIPEFWTFDRKKFPEGFKKECELVKKLNSDFGVWFGPRGGYTSQTPKYARLLKSIGYPMCKQSNDICAGSPVYIRDLCKKMADFCRDYNVGYFKIDGFAVTPCRSKKHGHPKGDKTGLYFYTFLWEEWFKGFENIRKVRPDVFINVTSYAHCSPYFLLQCDAVWLNNCADMGYLGNGSNLHQCLNYRDSKYLDFYEKRKLQFPTSGIYNHEPCYAIKNCNPPLTDSTHTPDASHPTVIYSAEEFRTYMYYCLMRGTGFVELYLSPKLMDEEKYAAATEALKWAEENFDVIKNSVILKGDPEKEEITGYYASDKKRAYLMLRNPSNREQAFEFIRKSYDFDSSPYKINEFYPKKGEETLVTNAAFTVFLKPYEIKLFELTTEI